MRLKDGDVNMGDVFRASTEVEATDVVHETKYGETSPVKYLTGDVSLSALSLELRLVFYDRHPWW